MEIFNLLVGEELRIHLVNSLNNRKNKRREHRNTQLNPNVRGRLSSSSSRRTPNNYSNNYKTLFSKDWDWEHYLKFFAIILSMGLSHQNWLTDYFKVNHISEIYGNSFVKKTMKKYVFFETMACVDGDVRFLFKKTDMILKNIWNPSQNISLDESCPKNKSHWNPHHTFIPRKPANRKNCIKVCIIL